MTLRKWMYLFGTTMLIGILFGTLTALILQALDQQFYLTGFKEYGYNIFWFMVGGALLGAFSHMFFFAYLIVRFIAIGVLKSKRLWDYIQIFFIVMTPVELYFFVLEKENVSAWNYALIPVIVIVLSIIIGFWKAKLTNWNAFIPTVFFISVATLFIATTGMKQNNAASTLIMVIPLFACNSWQILKLHTLLGNKKEPA